MTDKIKWILSGAAVLLLFWPPAPADSESLKPPEQPGIGMTDTAPPQNREEFEEKLGIRILGIREAASGNMLDLRYRVLDPDKATALTRKGTEIYLLDPESGARLSVPRTKLGPMRQTAVKPVPERNYFIFFGNADKRIKTGDRVTLVIDGKGIENLTVE
jgi:hypothetical protein